MKKRGALNPVVTAAILLTFLAVVFLVFFGEGLLPKVANAGENLADDVLGDLRKDKFEKTELETEKDLLDSYEKILKIFKTKGQGPCLVKYEELTDDFDGGKIILSNTKKGLFIKLLDKDERYPEQETIPNSISCTVIGEKAEIFYNNYLDESTCETNCPTDYVKTETVFIEKDEIEIDGKERDLKDQNLVYKTKEGYFCFLPTSDSTNLCNTEDTAVDNDGLLYPGCIDELKTKLEICELDDESQPAKLELEKFADFLEDLEKDRTGICYEEYSLSNIPKNFYFSFDKKDDKGLLTLHKLDSEQDLKIYTKEISKPIPSLTYLGSMKLDYFTTQFDEEGYKTRINNFVKYIITLDKNPSPSPGKGRISTTLSGSKSILINKDGQWYMSIDKNNNLYNAEQLTNCYDYLDE
tara:strand:+ start:1842 stop:3074 length:1233 start_codon:yes stop_codon:yes gene_type:complete